MKATCSKAYWKEFHADGQVVAEGNYINGVRVGAWKFYYLTAAISLK